MRERRSVYWTNLALLIWATGMSAIFGWRAYFLMQFTVMVFSGAAGVWQIGRAHV